MASITVLIMKKYLKFRALTDILHNNVGRVIVQRIEVLIVPNPPQLNK